MTLPAMIEAKSLTKRFGLQSVLNGVDLHVGEGRVVALIGPSGSGKSTLLRCLNLLTIPDGGSISVGEHHFEFGDPKKSLPADRVLAHFRAATGMVFQHFNLFPHMSVLANVMEGPLTVRRESRSVARERALGLLAKIGLAQRADAMPHHLSGGQKQRVAIARALAMEPRVMLFDEATSALDPELVGEVLGVIRDLAKDGMTMILVTHEMGFAKEVADEVAFMRDGSVVEFGPAREVLTAPAHPATVSFLARFRQVAAAQ